MHETKADADRKRLINEISRDCLVTRARRVSRVLTGIYDEALRPFGVSSAQFTLLVVVLRLQTASRAEIGRYNNQDRSTLTRNLQLILSQGWVEEVQHPGGGRSRSLVLTATGHDLVGRAASGWRSAQARAKAILGSEGAPALLRLADEIPREVL